MWVKQLLWEMMNTTFSFDTTFPLKIRRKADIDRFLPENAAASSGKIVKGYSRYPEPLRSERVKWKQIELENVLTGQFL